MGGGLFLTELVSVEQIAAGHGSPLIIATCGVLAIPAAWLAQAAPGAVILADVHGPIGGTLARLTVNPDGGWLSVSAETYRRPG